MRFQKEAKIEDMILGSHQRCHIMMAIPTLGMVPIEFMFATMRLQMPINGQVFQHVVKMMEVGKARDKAVQDVMNMKEEDRPKYIFFLGDDMLPEWDAFVKLYEEMESGKWDMLTGLYFWKGEPPTPLIWRNDHIGRMVPAKDFKVGEVLWCDLTGLDFTLIRVETLTKIKAPWFKTGPSLRSSVPNALEPYIKNESVVMHTEDAWFCPKLQAVGGKIGVHTGVRVSHIHVKTGNVY